MSTNLSHIKHTVAEPETIFLLAGAESRFFKVAPAASFRQAKQKSLVLVSNKMQYINVNMIQKRLVLIINFSRAELTI